MASNFALTSCSAWCVRWATSGLTFGTTMPANLLLRRMFERIPSVAGVCALRNGDKPPDSLWWDPCGANQAPENYAKGRELLLARMGWRGAP